jgi:hypothetical protein
MATTATSQNDGFPPFLRKVSSLSVTSRNLATFSPSTAVEDSQMSKSAVYRARESLTGSRSSLFLFDLPLFVCGVDDAGLRTQLTS